MAYERQNFVDGRTVLSAKHLQCIEDCLCEHETKLKNYEPNAPTSIDLTQFESNGVIVETYTDNSQKTYAMEFDENGNPIKITDSNGNVTVLTW